MYPRYVKKKFFDRVPGSKVLWPEKFGAGRADRAPADPAEGAEGLAQGVFVYLVPGSSRRTSEGIFKPCMCWFSSLLRGSISFVHGLSFLKLKSCWGVLMGVPGGLTGAE
jgi:hypothetical protein